MLTSDGDLIGTLTGLPLARRAELARLWGRLPESQRLEALRRQRKLASSPLLRRNYDPHRADECWYAALILALRDMSQEARATKIKKHLTEDAAQKLHLRQMEAFAERQTRSAPLRDRIVKQYLRLIADLRSGRNGQPVLGWRKCAAYLAKVHRVRVTPAHLRVIYLDAVGAGAPVMDKD